MVRIAICDDEPEAAAKEEALVRDALAAQGIGCETVRYTDSFNLFSDIADDAYFFDLLLLDIEMPGITGMELPERVRPFLPEVKIIFVTSHTEYAIDAYELSVFRYVPKDALGQKLPAAALDAARLIELEAGEEYVIQSAGRLEKLPYRDILYICRDGGKNAVIVSAHGETKVRKSLQTVFAELDAPEFLYIDRGCIVNLLHIMKLSRDTAFLKNGQALPISRSHLQDVRAQLTRYWGAHI